MTEDGAIDVDENPLSSKLLQIENQNKRATELLQLNSYNVIALKKLAPRLDMCNINTCVNSPHSCERQDKLDKASTIGSRFHATGGEFMNSDDFFVAEEIKQRNGGLKILKTNKEQQENKKIRELESKAAIQNLLVDKNKDAYNEEGAKSLDSKGLKVLYMWKHGKTQEVGQNKPQLLAAWNSAKIIQLKTTSLAKQSTRVN